ncbi:hypothetical protein [Caballeronia sp. GACF4]|uniref:hypothetical protein n=1 Tax=Caballeronia sp. GACF4 TaxID=2921763 RepID=UPI0020276D7D|nr:hypothetical protein [Caballeronia sp. GACF4]
MAEQTGETARTFDLPPTDVVALMRALLTRGPEAALPQNLPDAWLRGLLRDMVATLMPEGHDHLPVKLLVLSLASARKQAQPLPEAWDLASIFESEPFDSWLHTYHLALTTELISRHVGAASAHHTVEHFFDQD